MIELQHVTKRYDDKVAVDDLSFALKPGVVTGLLGPNGAGKSTTMRMVLGLDHPTSGSITVDGRPFRDSRTPMHTLGAMLDAHAIHKGRTARNHLQALAVSNGIPDSRTDEVLALSGCPRWRTNGWVRFPSAWDNASALLARPRALMLDEPVNGLDPEGVLWVRQLVRSLADQGTTVLVSSHLMAEMSQTTNHLIVMGRGRLIADAPISEVIDRFTRSTVLVRAPEPQALIDAVRSEGGEVLANDDGTLAITRIPVERVGELAAATATVLHELLAHHGSLEDAFLALTKDDVEYAPSTPGATA
jgi:ABC-2 type transport system ATP-binding protein